MLIKMVSLCYIFLFLYLFDAIFFCINAQPDTTNRLLRNPGLNTENRVNIPNPNRLRFPKDEPNEVELKAERKNVQLGESISLNAELKFENPRAVYNFYLVNSNWKYTYEYNSIVFNQFDSTGFYLFGVEVRVPGINRLLTDTLIIEVDSIDIDVYPTEVQMGKEVNFRISFNSIAENIQFRFIYGNSIPPGDWNGLKSSYIYESPGLYTVYAEVGRFDGNYLYDSYQSRKKIVKVYNPYEVSLISDKPNTSIGDEITFTAKTNTDRKDVKYLFLIEGAPYTRSASQPSVKYKFSKPATYTVTVQLLTTNNQLLATTFTTIEILPEGSLPKWLIYLIIVLGIVSVGTASYKWFYKPKVILYPKIDPGRQRFTDDKNFAFNLEFRKNFNFINSSYKIDLKKAKLIESMRRI
jgi:hypothetical protein